MAGQTDRTIPAFLTAAKLCGPRSAVSHWTCSSKTGSGTKWTWFPIPAGLTQRIGLPSIPPARRRVLCLIYTAVHAAFSDRTHPRRPIPGDAVSQTPTTPLNPIRGQRDSVHIRRLFAECQQRPSLDQSPRHVIASGGVSPCCARRVSRGAARSPKPSANGCCSIHPKSGAARRRHGGGLP